MLSTNEAEAGGFKEVILEVRGQGAYSALKYESGVHRVQRVPVTEAAGRIHTSTVTVAVLPEAEDIEVDIHPNDLRIDIFRASGPGGQSRQHDRLGGAHHARAHRRGRELPGREEPAAEQGAGPAHPARAPLRDGAGRAEQGARRAAAQHGRHRRPLAEDPHLQLPAEPRQRPPHRAYRRTACTRSSRARSTSSPRRSPPRTGASSWRRPAEDDACAAAASVKRGARAPPPGGCGQRVVVAASRRRAAACRGLGVRREALYAAPERLLDADRGSTASRASSGAARRTSRSPTSSGARPFAPSSCEVDETCSSRAPRPRPWSSGAGALAAGAGRARPAARLDIGTGSGAVALALAAEHPSVRVVATGGRPAALVDGAPATPRAWVSADRVEFVRRRPVRRAAAAARFDVIVSNPPYVTADERGSWSPRCATTSRTARCWRRDGLDSTSASSRGARLPLRPAACWRSRSPAGQARRRAGAVRGDGAVTTMSLERNGPRRRRRASSSARGREAA